jgi:hypothetical protein
MSYNDDTTYTDQEIVFNKKPLTRLIKRDYRGSDAFVHLDECVLLSRIAGAARAAGELQRAHHRAVKESKLTWHLDMSGPGTGSAHYGGNPLRQYFDEGLTVASTKRIFGYQTTGQEEAHKLLEAALLFEQGQDRHPFLALCALRLRLCAACYNQEKTAKYLSVSMYALRQLDGFLKVPYPPRPYWKIALNRKRAPKKGWAAGVLSVSLHSKVTQEESLRRLLKPRKPSVITT